MKKLDKMIDDLTHKGLNWVVFIYADIFTRSEKIIKELGDAENISGNPPWELVAQWIPVAIEIEREKLHTKGYTDKELQGMEITLSYAEKLAKLYIKHGQSKVSKKLTKHLDVNLLHYYNQLQYKAKAQYN